MAGSSPQRALLPWMDKVVDRLAAVAMSEPGKAFAGARLGVRPARCARVDANTTSGSCPSDSNSRTNAGQPGGEADADALRQAIEHPGLAAVGIGFLAGLFFSFNPVAMAPIPVSLTYVTRARETREAMRFGSAFILGMIVTHVLLGFIAGLGASEPPRGGEPLTRDYAPTPMLSPRLNNAGTDHSQRRL
jgi:hypothetical protein